MSVFDPSRPWGGQYSPVDPGVVTSRRADGSWSGRILRDLLSEAAARWPGRTALVEQPSGGTRRAITYREFDAAADVAAGRLTRLGVGKGDVVAVMAPNGIDYPTLVFGINAIGAVYTGIPVAYGERQAAAVLKGSRARVLVVPRSWRRTDLLELSRRLRADIPTLEHVVVLGDTAGAVLGAREVRWEAVEPAPPGPPPRPEDVCYLGFTSGTTGLPKGAMHTHETLLHPADALYDHLGSDTFGMPMVQLVGSPVGHHTGLVWGILFTVRHGGTGVHLESWNPDAAADVIRSEGATTMFGAPTFLQDLLRTSLANDPTCPLRSVIVAGSSVPRTLPARGSAALSAYIAPAWGMTECGILTSATPREDDSVLGTDGSVLPGSEVRVVDADRAEVPAGVVGDLLMRGPGVTLGYLDRDDATRASFDDDLWFATGDTASVDAHGWLEIHGRTKDIIIRGGENIPVADVESVILEDPDVLAAAVVAYPDERLGERACAVLVVRDGAEVDLRGLNDRLSAAGLSRHYLPERLVLRDELPMTPSGKIQKFKLRELVAHDHG
jgi:cyclohexanecarboxylate-CoA ligase